MWKIFLTVHLSAVFGGCQLIRAPSNTAVIVGQRLEMICQPKNEYTIREWTMQRSSSSSPQKIYLNWSEPRIIGNRQFGYDIRNNNSVLLYLNSTELDDAGSFACAVNLGTEQPNHYSAQLTVLETEPICEERMTTAYSDTFEEGSIFWIRCSLNFRGNVAPTIEWRQHGGDAEMDERGRIMADMVTTIVIPDVNISSTLTVVLNATYNATFYTCKTFFQSDTTSIENSTATNAPDYSYTWNSSIVIISATNLAKEEKTMLSASTSVFRSTNASTLTSPFNAIYLVAGGAILFGIASSLVAIFLCLRLRGKNSTAQANIDSTEPAASEYDLIPYACTDGYDTIEEVNEKDDFLLNNFPPRLGVLPSPGYSALMLDEPKPPGVYSRMKHEEKLFNETESKADGNKLQSNTYESAPNYSELSDFSRKGALRSNAYLALRTEVHEDIADEIPSAYLKIYDSSLHSVNNNALENIQDHSNRMPKLCPNAYLALAPEVVKDNAVYSEEIPSAYLKITDESFKRI